MSYAWSLTALHVHIVIFAGTVLGSCGVEEPYSAPCRYPDNKSVSVDLWCDMTPLAKVAVVVGVGPGIQDV